MRQKEKRRKRKAFEDAKATAELMRRQRDPADSLYIPVLSAECTVCGVEFDPKLYKGCPACRR